MTELCQRRKASYLPALIVDRYPLRPDLAAIEVPLAVEHVAINPLVAALPPVLRELFGPRVPGWPEVDRRVVAGPVVPAVGLDDVYLGASPRAIIVWGRLAKVWALLVRRRDEVYPEDIQDLAPYVLSHRLWLGPHAASHGLTTDAVIKDIIEKTPIP